jgi:cytochrome bd-type quinol oxidase subunit 2
VVRGVPLDRSGHFCLPFWNSFSIGPDASILDGYTLPVAASAFLTLAQHGALRVAFKTEATLELRARQAARGLWCGVLAFAAAITVVSFRCEPHLDEGFRERRERIPFALGAVSGLVAMRVFSGLRALLACCAFIIGMLASGVYPDVFAVQMATVFSLLIYNAATPDYGVEVGLTWFVPGILLAAAYFFSVYRSFSSKLIRL